ncbi:MAG: type IX secretion system sortase PorU [Bacteroidetes bacterium]|nr:type IX secretion system sortase PorU [Bacteroidota bacterium]
MCNKHFIFSIILILIAICSFANDSLYNRDSKNEQITNSSLAGIELELEQPNIKSLAFSSNSVLAHGRWFKISVSENGIYKINYSELNAMGVNMQNLNPKDIRIYGNGGGMLPEKNSETKYHELLENAIMVVGEEDGKFGTEDYILFYGESPHSWTYSENLHKFEHHFHSYSDHTYYFLTTDLGLGKRISLHPSETESASSNISEFQDHIFHEVEQYNIINSGRTWYGEAFDANVNQDFIFEFANLVLSKNMNIKIDVAGRSSGNNSFRVIVNNQELSGISIPGINFSSSYPPYARTGSLNANLISNEESININLIYNRPNSSSIGWLNYIELNAWRRLIFEGSQLSFRNTETIGSGNVTQFHLSQVNSNVKIWNVTNPLEVTIIESVLNGSSLDFKVRTDSLLEFVAYNGSDFLQIEIDGEIQNQNLHALQPVDYIIITPDEFYSQALRLAEYHEIHDGFSYCIVSPNQIYNEFSSGAQDVSAIRNFVKMLYDRADQGSEPKYLLLFGDASFDYKDRVATNTNFVPTWESEQSTAIISSFNTDDYFGLLDSDEGQYMKGDLDIGIGRIPIKTIEQATDMVDKIIHYSTNSSENMGLWRSTVCLVSDDEDYNTYVNNSEEIALYLDNSFNNINVDKVYFDSYAQVSTPGGQRYPEATKIINEKVEKGVIIINYIGHGGETGWAHERVLELSDINSWRNYNKLPVFITATCEFTRFDDPERESAGELVLLNNQGGSISLFTTTRATSSGANFQLNKQVLKHTFEKTNGTYNRQGDIIRKSKNAMGNGGNTQRFVLVGDPAMLISFPMDSISVLKINDEDVKIIPDTITALSKIEISGSVYGSNEIKKSDFNGILSAIVYDKKSILSTLGQDKDSFEQTFTLQNNILYQGKASVENGDFTLSFVVPKDIMYNYGLGKISLSAYDENSDAWGCFENLVIGGGYDETLLTDTDGPEIELFLNDDSFKNGGLTNSKPILLARITDESGINTIGSGIGHDIVAVLDQDIENTFVLNDFFEADLNSYTSGTIVYPLSELGEGPHQLKLKIWDVVNNSSIAVLDLVVVDQDQFIIENLINYPNPFLNETSFLFDHNQANTTLNIEIQIYGMDGQKVRTLRKSINANGFNSGPIRWDGTSDFGSKLDPGMYIYRIIFENQKLDSPEQINKLVIIR